MRKTDSLEKTLMLERLKVGEGDDGKILRGRFSIMSPLG